MGVTAMRFRWAAMMIVRLAPLQATAAPSPPRAPLQTPVRPMTRLQMTENAKLHILAPIPGILSQQRQLGKPSCTRILYMRFVICGNARPLRGNMHATALS